MIYGAFYLSSLLIGSELVSFTFITFAFLLVFITYLLLPISLTWISKRCWILIFFSSFMVIDLFHDL
jgi:hypothetical protein